MSLFLDKMLMYWLSCWIRQQGTTVPLSTCASQVKILYSPTHTSPGTIWWPLFPTFCGVSFLNLTGYFLPCVLSGLALI